MHHVEFMGMPGSGKSTISSHLIDGNPLFKSIDDAYIQSIIKLLSGYNLLFFNRFENILKVLYRMIDGDRGFNIHTVRSSEHISTLSQYINMYTGDETRVDYVSYRMYDLIEKYSMIRQYCDDDVRVILDEGFTHGTCSVFCSPCGRRDVDKEHIIEYVSSIPTPDKIIYLRASIETCKQRMRQRDRPDDAEWIKKDIIEQLKLTRCVLETVYDYFVEKDDCDVICINTEDDVHSVVTGLKKRISVS